MFQDLNWTLLFSVVVPTLGLVTPLIVLLFQRKEHRQLDVVLDKEVFVVNELAGDLRNFSILIDGKPASEQVVWITGWIINSGDVDISERIVEHPLKFTLPNSMKWLRIAIDHSSTDVDCSINVIDEQKVEFEWTLLRSGEYIYFDSLIECPLDETKEIWDTDSFSKTISIHSRIENIRTNSIIPISQLGERSNSSTPRKSKKIPKFIISAFAVLQITLFWITTLLPFGLDDLYGDGFLPARPTMFRVIDGTLFKIDVFIDKNDKVKMELNDRPKGVPYWKEEFDGAHSDIFRRSDVRVGKISARDLTQSTPFMVLLSVFTLLITWILIFLWFPVNLLFNSKKRKTASAIYAVRKKRKR